MLMIRSFRNKPLKALFIDGTTAKVAPDLHARCLVILDALDAATRPEDMNVPGWRFHGLQGKPKRWTVHVNGPWCITFEWEDGDAFRVDLENYH
ncbi:type II toxin-antitoxin system RelE/ParE family toxin [Pararhodospirillum oryzae]|uniref:Plasmid maintenance system killer protein n=1 Tax=Pararhodospirillum oryzae TaxID=478448 RepID=A0A512H8D3_9PROT|nr:type II toxin-antitoxin system RelE/ParE family toxin [Pararhodospirillum oryzae]GEO81715.1 plasmid maintenance system killer protein [Pararhodospirillum oryzae]